MSADANCGRREFTRLVLPLYENLYGAAMRMTRDPAEAEDLVQDTMVRAFRFWETFVDGTNIKAWMFTILRNTYINGYHRQGRRLRRDNTIASLAKSSPTMAIAGSLSGPPGPEEAVAEAATQEAISQALASIPEDYRRAVTLADLEGLSYKEIADIMDTPIGTVMSRIYRGRKMLHKLLHDHAPDAPRRQRA